MSMSNFDYRVGDSLSNIARSLEKIARALEAGVKAFETFTQVYQEKADYPVYHITIPRAEETDESGA